MATEALGTDPVADLLVKLNGRDVVVEREERRLRSAIGEIKDYEAGTTFIRAGIALTRSALLVEGMVARYKDLADGQRQIMELHVPGDFVDLHGFLLKRIEHNIAALTPVRIAYVPHENLRAITEEEPHLARLLWFATLVDASIQREKILSVGRRPALGRVAHLLCELYVRLEMIGAAGDCVFDLPLTQQDLADATGLTSVHVNRMLKKLRDDTLVTFRGGRVVIHDWERLKRIAEFEPAYLYLERRPR